MIQLLINADLYLPEPAGLGQIAIAGDRILAIAKELPSLEEGWVTETVDLEGRRLIPGLIDGHVHMTGGGGESGPSSRVPPLGMSRYTRHGITSVVGLLGTDDLTRSTGDLVTAARGLREEGLSAWCYTGGYHLPATTLTGSVRSDIVYLDPVIGVGELAVSDHRSSQPTLDELLRVASEAHVAGLMTGKAGTVHLHMGDGERGLDLVRQALSQSELPQRTFHPTHVNRRRALFVEALDLARTGTVIDITAFPAELAGDEEVLAHHALERYIDEGLPSKNVTVSSDGGGCLPTFGPDGRVAHMGVGDPGGLLACLADCLKGGLALDSVLPAFTSNVAELLRLSGKGRLAPGSAADLVALDDSHAAHDVMALGRWHRRGGVQQIVGTFEPDGQPSN